MPIKKLLTAAWLPLNNEPEGTKLASAQAFGSTAEAVLALRKRCSQDIIFCRWAKLFNELDDIPSMVTMQLSKMISRGQKFKDGGCYIFGCIPHFLEMLLGFLNFLQGPRD